MSERVSPHLTWDELHCWDRTVRPWRLLAVYPLDWRGTRAQLLAREFEAVRALLSDRLGHDMALNVLSAYRTPAYNARVGGSPRSQHVQGRALDLRPRDPAALEALLQCVRDRAAAVPAIRGIGWYPAKGFVHLDVRPSPHLVQWTEEAP